MTGRAGAMTEYIARRDSFTGDALRELEARKVGSDRDIPDQFAFIDQHRQRHRSKSLGAGGDTENGLRRHIQPGLSITLAEALGQHGLSILDKPDGYSWHLPLRHHGPHKVFIALQAFGMPGNGLRHDS